MKEGLGPIFNEASCAACHGFPATGGSDPGTAFNVTHYTVTYLGAENQAFEFGGPVQQIRSIAGMDGAGSCNAKPDVIPGNPGMNTSSRHSPPVFGFGLLDAVTDAEILKYQGLKPWKLPSVVGVASWGVEMQGVGRSLAVSLDATRTQPYGAARVGRFGWKSQTATLWQFTTEPFNIEPRRGSCTTDAPRPLRSPSTRTAASRRLR